MTATLSAVTGPSAGIRVRRAELLQVLSLGADLGLGQPLEHVLRECLIAVRLAERLGLDQPARTTAFYTALMTWLGKRVIVVTSRPPLRLDGEEYGKVRLVYERR